MKTPIKAKKKICKGFRRSAGHKGEPCKMRAVEGSDYCKYHGGGAVGKKTGKGRPKGSPKPKGSNSFKKGHTKSIKHGAYSPRLLPEEQPIYEAYLDEYMKDVQNPSVTDRRALERLAVLETKWHTAVTQGAQPDALDILHRLLHRELKALQVTRESKDNTNLTGNSPAEVVAALLMKVRAVDEPRQVNALEHDPDVIDVEVKPFNSDDDGQKE